MRHIGGRSEQPVPQTHDIIRRFQQLFHLSLMVIVLLKLQPGLPRLDLENFSEVSSSEAMAWTTGGKRSFCEKCQQHTVALRGFRPWCLMGGILHRHA